MIELKEKFNHIYMYYKGCFADLTGEIIKRNGSLINETLKNIMKGKSFDEIAEINSKTGFEINGFRKVIRIQSSLLFKIYNTLFKGVI